MDYLEEEVFLILQPKQPNTSTKAYRRSKSVLVHDPMWSVMYVS